MVSLSLVDFEIYEHICPACNRQSKRTSSKVPHLDGGLSSIFYGECGHFWICSPGKWRKFLGVHKFTAEGLYSMLC